MAEKCNVLVTGATGYIGRRLVEKLLESEQYDIHLFVRNHLKVQLSIVDKVDIREGTTFDEDSLDAALKGIDVAFYLIHSMGNTEDFADLDRKSAENFREACIKNGVKRIIYLGGLGVKASASEHLMSRIETGEVLSAKPDKIQTIWIRAGIIVGSGSASFEIVRHLCQKLPVMTTPKWVRTLSQPVGVSDVLSYLMDSIHLEHPDNLMVDIGTDPMTFQDMMKETAKIMGLARFLFPVPVLTPKLSSYWLILITPIPYRIASALVEGLKSETLLQNDNARVHYPQITPMSFNDSVRQAIAEQENRQVISRWCDSSSTDKCDITDFDDPTGAIFREIRTLDFPAGQTAEQVFENVCSVGGENGWFRFTPLWKLRGIMDKFMGGYGLSRGRRCEKALRIGDALDFWKVVDLKKNKRLLLFAQMRLPGRGWLEFDVHEDYLVQTAHFIPNGLLGRMYWYFLIPVHHFVFNNMAKTLVNNTGKTE